MARGIAIKKLLVKYEILSISSFNGRANASFTLLAESDLFNELAI